MNKAEKELFWIQQVICQINDLRRTLPDLEDSAYVTASGDRDAAKLRRFRQCKRLDEALRELALDLENDRAIYEKVADREAEHGEED